MNWLQKLFQKKESDKIKWNHNSWNDCPERGSASLDNPISNQWGYYGDTENDNSFDRAVNHNKTDKPKK